MKTTSYRHEFDLAFAVDSDSPDPETIDPQAVLAACRQRLDSVDPENWRDAFGHVATDATESGPELEKLVKALGKKTPNSIASPRDIAEDLVYEHFIQLAASTARSSKRNLARFLLGLYGGDADKVLKHIH